MSLRAQAVSRLEALIHGSLLSDARISVLSGAGISAESGIPTFRGPEGYWRVGSAEYRPEEMATNAMFRRSPWEVWAWYLYRRTVCARAEPNRGHQGVASMEKSLGDRFRLITQNVDGLHLRAGNTEARSFQIHGNIHFMRCAASCREEIFPMPDRIGEKGRNEPVSEEEKGLLLCPACGALARPHVLWFDEFYTEHLFRAESAVRWAANTDLLIVVGTSGATTLPTRIGEIVFRNKDAVLVDVNPSPNPFRVLVERHPNGIVFDAPSGEVIPLILPILESSPNASA